MNRTANICFFLSSLIGVAVPGGMLLAGGLSVGRLPALASAMFGLWNAFLFFLVGAGFIFFGIGVALLFLHFIIGKTTTQPSSAKNID